VSIDEKEISQKKVRNEDGRGPWERNQGRRSGRKYRLKESK